MSSKAGYCQPCQVVFEVEGRDVFADSVFCPRCLQRQEVKALATINTQVKRHPELPVIYSLSADEAEE